MPTTRKRYPPHRMYSVWTHDGDSIRGIVLSFSNYHDILKNTEDRERAERKLRRQAVVVYYDGHVGGYNTLAAFQEEWTEVTTGGVCVLD